MLFALFCNTYFAKFIVNIFIAWDIMDNNDQTPEDYIEIANKVRSGEYFRDARAMADINIHNPMPERYLFILLTILSLVITYVSILALEGLIPLKPQVPFIFVTNDIVEDYPQIKPLVNYPRENPNIALQRFLVQHYIGLREEYNAKLFDRNHDAILILSDKKTADEYENYILPTNPESPVTLYQRNMERKINVIYTEFIDENKKDKSEINEYYMRVIFDATVIKGEDEKSTSRHQVDIAFKYKDIKLDTATMKIDPYGFIVTSYNKKNL